MPSMLNQMMSFNVLSKLLEDLSFEVGQQETGVAVFGDESFLTLIEQTHSLHAELG